MLARMFFVGGALALTIACDPTTPSGTTPDPDTEVDADTAVDADTVPCPSYWGGEFPPLQVDEWSYQGETVYLASPDCCDQYREVRDAETCEYICAPDGGFTGAGDGRCPRFLDEATFLRTVWVNPDE